MIYKPSARYSVTHAGRFEGVPTFDKELQIAVYLIGQIEIVCQLTWVDLDLLAWLVGMLELFRHCADFEVAQVIEAACVRVLAVQWNRHGTLDDGIARVRPLLAVVAHEKAAVRV
jgi:hypothetical protein